jgi:hypothetical protein
MEYMEHVGVVNMGGEELTIPTNFFGEAFFSFIGGDLHILIAPDRSEPFTRKEIVSIVSIGGCLMSERDILSRIRRLQASGDGSRISQIALNLLRGAKKDVLKAKERGIKLNILLDLI